MSLKTRSREDENPWRKCKWAVKQKKSGPHKESFYPPRLTLCCSDSTSVMHTPQSTASLSHKLWKGYLLSPKEAEGICKRQVAPCFRIPFSKQDIEFSTSSANSHAVLRLQKCGLGSGEVCHIYPGKFKPQFRIEWYKSHPFALTANLAVFWTVLPLKKKKIQVPTLCSPATNIPSEVCTAFHL